MSLASHQRHLSRLNVWALPLLFMAVALFGHVISGALAWPPASDDQQRDFNTALAFTLLTGCLWAAVRYIHQHVASTLITVLLQRNQLGHFNRHRWQLGRYFSRQVLICCGIAPVMMMSYVLGEGLVSRLDEPDVFMLSLSAVPFWLFFLLFIAQVITITRYIFQLAFSHDDNSKDDIDTYKAVFSLVLGNAQRALACAAIIPLFWLNRTMSALDLALVVATITVLAAFFLYPVCRICLKIKAYRVELARDIDLEVSEIVRQQARGERVNNVSERLERLYRKREKAIHFVNGRQIKTLVLAASLLPLTLLLIHLA